MSDITDKLRQAGINPGTRIEVVIFEGAEFDDGWTPAPTFDTQGYGPAEGMTSKEGLRFSAYLWKLTEYEGKVSVHTASGWDVNERQPVHVDAGSGFCYFHEDVIARVLGPTGKEVYKKE